MEIRAASRLRRNAGLRAPLTSSHALFAAWVRERQHHIFSQAQQRRYTQLIERGVEGQEKKDLTTTVAGIKVQYYN